MQLEADVPTMQEVLCRRGFADIFVVPQALLIGRHPSRYLCAAMH
jgi:hypothetical protein